MTFIGPWSESTWLLYIVKDNRQSDPKTPTSHLCTELKTQQKNPTKKPQAKPPKRWHIAWGTEELLSSLSPCPQVNVPEVTTVHGILSSITSRRVPGLYLSEEMAKSSEQN